MVLSAGSTSEGTTTNAGETLTEQQEDPPEPVLPVKVAGEVIRKLDQEEGKHFLISLMRLTLLEFFQIEPGFTD